MLRVPKVLLLLMAILLETGLATASNAQNSEKTDSLLQLADECFHLMDEEKSLNLYLQVLEIDNDNYTALWNASLLFAREGFRQDEDESKRELYKRSLYYAEKVMLSYPDSGHSHYVYAVSNGRLSDLSDKKERIKKSHLIKKHIDRAVLIDPDYAPSWHLYGVWHSSIANISKAEKLAANMISEGIPSGSSHEKAEEYLKRAIEIRPEQILFRLDLAKHYKNSGQHEEAERELKKILKLEPKFMDDADHLENARNLLEEIQ